MKITRIILTVACMSVGGVGAYAASCVESECSNSMMRAECGTTGNGVECTYEDGDECDATPNCTCRKSFLDFVYGIGCTCTDGQYGRFGTGPCYNCPDGWWSDSGVNEYITSCYIPYGTSVSNSKGRYEYSQDCYYTE